MLSMSPEMPLGELRGLVSIILPSWSIGAVEQSAESWPLLIDVTITV